MKKEAVIILSLLATNAFAVQFVNKVNNTDNKEMVQQVNQTTTGNGSIVVDETMQSKVGIVDLIDEKSLTINKTVYKKSIDCRIYGKLLKGSYIKFNTNRSNQIIDIWILK